MSIADIKKNVEAKMAKSVEAFKNELSAQTGKKISAADAAVLLQLVNALEQQ